MDLKITVDRQRLILQNKSKPVADSVNYLTLSFSFSADWDGTAKTAVFTHGDNTYTQLLDSDSIIVPHEVIASPGFDLSVYGSVGTKRITADVINIPVAVSGYKDGQTPEPPTPTVYDQIISLCGEARDTAQSVRDDADNGKFTPKRSVDYWTDDDKTEIVGDVLSSDEIQQLSVNETERITAESKRQSDENARAESEAERQKSEKSRVKAETERASAENNRQLNESARTGAETKRQTAETERVSKENERQSKEAARESAESARISTENDRAAAEAERITAESKRQSAEAERQSNEAKRQEAYNGKADMLILSRTADTSHTIDDGGDYPLVELSVIGESDYGSGTPSISEPVYPDSIEAPAVSDGVHTANFAGITLRSFSRGSIDVHDEILMTDGTVKLYQRVGVHAFDGTEALAAKAPPRYTLTGSNKRKPGSELSIKCSHYATAASSTIACVSFTTYSSQIVQINNTGYTYTDGGTAFKSDVLKAQYDKGTPVTIYYPLADDIVTDITDTEAGQNALLLATVLGTTTITSTALTELRYKADTTKAYNKLVSAIIALGGTT